jgi:hypothetical protein
LIVSVGEGRRSHERQIVSFLGSVSLPPAVRVSEGDLGRYTLSPDRVVTPRRNLEQALHCAEEALGVLSRREDDALAFDDLAHAQELVIHVRKQMRVDSGYLTIEESEESILRSLEKVVHCLREALSVVERGEDLRCADDDLACSQSLMALVRGRVRVRLLNGGRCG